jgi:hypothetical protein
VLLAFGDHLPGLRLHQWKIGWKKEDDPHLHEVPFVVASNIEDASALRERLNGRPFTCFSPVVIEALALGVADRYMSHMTKICGSEKRATFTPAEAVLHNQLFSESPQP